MNHNRSYRFWRSAARAKAAQPYHADYAGHHFYASVCNIRHIQYALLVLISVPFSLVGGIVALRIRGINMSVSAAGFISLFGVAVMAGVLIVSEIYRRREANGADVKEAVIRGALAQMRPTLMMVLVAMFGMIPAATAKGIGSDVQRPLATVVVGGLISTVMLMLLALPALYYLMNRGHNRGRPLEATGP